MITSTERSERVCKMTAINDGISEPAIIFKGVSAYASTINLLNKKYQYYLGYPMEGFNLEDGLISN